MKNFSVLKQYDNNIINNIKTILRSPDNKNIEHVIDVVTQITSFNINLIWNDKKTLDSNLTDQDKLYISFQEYISDMLVNMSINALYQKRLVSEFPHLAGSISNLTSENFCIAIRKELSVIKLFTNPTKEQLFYYFYTILNGNHANISQVIETYLSYGFYDNSVTISLLSKCCGYTGNYDDDSKHKLMEIAAKTINSTDRHLYTKILRLSPEFIMYIKHPSIQNIIDAYYNIPETALSLKTLPTGSQYQIGSQCPLFLKTNLISNAVKTKIIKHNPELIIHITNPTRSQVYAAYNNGYRDAIFLLTNPTKQDINKQIMTKLKQD